ncbi:MAG: hypothetical protein GY754_24260 [bacterium]|nr:hypothetical protein [bacterium]
MKKIFNSTIWDVIPVIILLVVSVMIFSSCGNGFESSDKSNADSVADDVAVLRAKTAADFLTGGDTDIGNITKLTILFIFKMTIITYSILIILLIS